MKKILSIISILLLVCIMGSGCNASDSEQPANGAESDAAADGKLKIVSTLYAPYDFARAVTGDRAELTMLLPPAAESHSFEPTPSDIIAIQNCDVFIYIGGESEEWVERILESVDLSSKQVLSLMDSVSLVEEEIVEGMEEEDEEEEGEAYDEHIWTSPINAGYMTTAICDAVKAADPANAEFYDQNTRAYLEKLTELDAHFRSIVASAARKTIVFGDRFPFRYFADEYGLDYYAAFPGCSTETEASAATVAFLIDKVNDEKIPVIFHIELANEDMANTIAEATGAKPLLLHSCHNITRDEFVGGVTYLDLMSRNLDTLREALM
ncbi:MAG: metal ABC transporter substrate-binding protein [Clostridiales Family XIII bacterium]|jgi:zinc transport system substrate-binding protein|nr:metal ABC transporter substrate-binding protein [Clostridiales Family XIII bacterium]